jgi:hypothetical protein
LGFREIHISSAEKPLFCQDAERTFVYMPVTKEGIIPVCEDVVRIYSTEEDSSRKARATGRMLPHPPN